MIGILAQLYTICPLVGYFPAAWKSATGTMLHEPGKQSKRPGSYRPISLLSCLGKLFEKVISARLNLHMLETGFYNSFQRAFRQGLEGGEHLYRLAEEIATTKTKGFKTAVASLDVEKAFDSVWHNGLRHKLAAAELQLPTKLIRLLSSYLDGRTIQVRHSRGPSLYSPVPLRAASSAQRCSTSS